MLELGEKEEEGHRLVGKRAADVVDHLVTIGKRAEIIADEALACGFSAQRIMKLADRDSTTAYLKQNLRQGDVVLVKGSHGMRLDRMVSALEQTSPGV
jgi:UDP-N-acetylmuramoyl-tripeptide--D-alanyl-D-alanine ligase